VHYLCYGLELYMTYVEINLCSVLFCFVILKTRASCYELYMHYVEINLCSVLFCFVMLKARTSCYCCVFVA